MGGVALQRGLKLGGGGVAAEGQGHAEVVAGIRAGEGAVPSEGCRLPALHGGFFIPLFPAENQRQTIVQRRVFRRKLQRPLQLGQRRRCVLRVRLGTAFGKQMGVIGGGRHGFRVGLRGAGKHFPGLPQRPAPGEGRTHIVEELGVAAAHLPRLLEPVDAFFNFPAQQKQSRQPQPCGGRKRRIFQLCFGPLLRFGRQLGDLVLQGRVLMLELSRQNAAQQRQAASAARRRDQAAGFAELQDDAALAAHQRIGRVFMIAISARSIHDGRFDERMESSEK